jgi:hypothetical protein
MKSAVLGKSISKVEVTNITKHGFWLMVREEGLFSPSRISHGLRTHLCNLFLM